MESRWPLALARRSRNQWTLTQPAHPRPAVRQAVKAVSAERACSSSARHVKAPSLYSSSSVASPCSLKRFRRKRFPIRTSKTLPALSAGKTSSFGLSRWNREPPSWISISVRRWRSLAAIPRRKPRSKPAAALRPTIQGSPSSSPASPSSRKTILSPFAACGRPSALLPTTPTPTTSWAQPTSLKAISKPR